MTHRNHHEREFEAFLAGEESELARLYRRLPQAEPDAKLDAAVLGLARAAVEPQRVNALRHAKSRHPRPWWLVGLSSAAGVVLAAGIAWQMRHGLDGHPAANMKPPSPSTQAGREVIPISAIIPPIEAEATPAAPAAPPEPAPAFSDRVSGAAAAKSQPPVQRLAKPAAPQRDAGLARAKTEAAADIPQVAPVAVEPPLAPAPAAPPAPVQAGPAEPQAPPAAAGTGGDALAARSDKGDTAAAAQPFADSDRVSDHNSVERKAAIASGSRREEYGLSAEEAVAGTAQARPEIRQRAAAAPERYDNATRRTTDTPRNSEAAPKDATAAATTPAAAVPPLGGASAGPARSGPSGEAARRATALEHNAALAPAQWIDQIQLLLREQRHDEARENLDLFRKRHPDYALPAALRDLK